MAELPGEVSSAIVRGLGAYLRSQPASELPPRVRPLQHFRDKALIARKPELLAALDDPGLRARVLEWLDEKPSLPKADAEALRVASERADDWEQVLAGKATSRPAKQAPSTATDPLARVAR